jgi:hypothetical protein
LGDSPSVNDEGLEGEPSTVVRYCDIGRSAPETVPDAAPELTPVPEPDALPIFHPFERRRRCFLEKDVRRRSVACVCAAKLVCLSDVDVSVGVRRAPVNDRRTVRCSCGGSLIFPLAGSWDVLLGSRDMVAGSREMVPNSCTRGSTGGVLRFIPPDRASSVGMCTLGGASSPLGVTVPSARRGIGMADAGRRWRPFSSSAGVFGVVGLARLKYGEPGDGDGRWKPGEKTRDWPETARDCEPLRAFVGLGVRGGAGKRAAVSDVLRMAFMVPWYGTALGLLGESVGPDARRRNVAVMRLPFELDWDRGDGIDDVVLGDRRFAGSGGIGGTSSSASPCTCARPAPTEELRFLEGDRSGESLDPPDSLFQKDGRFSRMLSIEGAGLMVPFGVRTGDGTGLRSGEGDADGVPSGVLSGDGRAFCGDGVPIPNDGTLRACGCDCTCGCVCACGCACVRRRLACGSSVGTGVRRGVDGVLDSPRRSKMTDERVESGRKSRADEDGVNGCCCC